jgi:hypothetical protein
MTATSPQSPPHDWLHHLEDEADAAFLYRELAQAERDPGRADSWLRWKTGMWSCGASCWQKTDIP